jgi:beta-lactamase class A
VLPRTKLRRRMMDTAAAERGDENVSTPVELARLMTIIVRGQGLSPNTRDEMLAMLRTVRTSYLRRGVPAGVKVASKIGQLDGLRVDAGFVEVRDRPYVMVMMLGLLGDGQGGEDAIERASRATYEYFRRLAAASPYGRLKPPRE